MGASPIPGRGTNLPALPFHPLCRVSRGKPRGRRFFMNGVQRFETSSTDDERYRLLIDAVIDYAIFMLDPAGIVTSWNPGAEKCKGYTAPEIIGSHFSCFYMEEDRRAELPARALEIAAREGRHESEGWRVRKDGTQFWAHTVDRPDPRRRPANLIGFAMVTRDLHRAQERPGRSAPERGAVPAAGAGRHRLRDLHARCRRLHHQLERGRRAHQGLSLRGDHRASTSRVSTPRRTGRTARRSGRWRPRSGTAGSRRKAGACARTAAISGRCDHRSHPRRRAAGCWASPRSPATSPSGAMRKRRSTRPARRCSSRRRWKPWAS